MTIDQSYNQPARSSSVGLPSAERPLALSNVEPAVSYRSNVGLIVQSAVITDPEVIAEARRWTKGTRGEPVEPTAADGADLSEFHRTVVGVGARVLHVHADNAAAFSLTGTVTQLAEKAEAAGTRLVDHAVRASEAATKATKEASEATAKMFESEGERFVKSVSLGLSQNTNKMLQEVDRLFAGNDGPAVQAFKNVVVRTMGDAQVGLRRDFTNIMAEFRGTLDINNPSSPLSVLAREVRDVSSKVDQLAGVVAMADAVAKVRDTSPAKGRPYEVRVGDVLEKIAAAVPCSYIDTAGTVGRIRNCKKGDGVLEGLSLEPEAPAPRVQVEFTTEKDRRRNWNQYMDQAQRNRDAQASLGLVPSRDLVPGTGLIHIISPTRIVLAYDPDHDEPDLLRATLQLLLAEAQRRLVQDRAGDLSLADRLLAEARQEVVDIGDQQKTAVGLRDGAAKLVVGLENRQARLILIVDQARAALATSSSADAEGDEPPLRVPAT